MTDFDKHGNVIWPCGDNHNWGPWGLTHTLRNWGGVITRKQYRKCDLCPTFSSRITETRAEVTEKIMPTVRIGLEDAKTLLWLAEAGERAGEVGKHDYRKQDDIGDALFNFRYAIEDCQRG